MDCRHTGSDPIMVPLAGIASCETANPRAGNQRCSNEREGICHSDLPQVPHTAAHMFPP